MSVPREVTQKRLAVLSAGTLRYTPSQKFTVADRIEERAAADPDRVFAFFEDRRVSYGELNRRANRVASAALSLGLRRGDVVSLMMENRPEFISTWAGLAKLGVTTALINTQLRGDALAHVLDTARARHLIVGSECLEKLEGVSGADRVVAVDVDPDHPAELPRGAWSLSGALERGSERNPDPGLRAGLVAGDDLFHIFTSGTTGLPKAARLSHMRFLGVGDGMSAVAGYGRDEVIACVLPLFHGAAGMVVVSCALHHGGAIALRRRFSASQFWSDAVRYGTTAFQYIGEICRYLLNQPEGPLDRAHKIRVMMGAGLGRDIWPAFQQRFGVEQILEGWSSTEANTSLLNVDNKVGSCGRIPFPEYHNGRLIRYDDETGVHPRGSDGLYQLCAPGEIGEFIGVIPDLPDSGAGRFEGYTSSEATDAKILHDVLRKGDRCYRSGDLLRCDEDGYYYFVDRIGDTFRWKSENVSTQEVAESLGAFPGLEIANVFGVRVPGTEGRAGMAALVLRDPAAFDGRAFYAYTEQRLPSYAAPVFVRLSSSADITSTFKLKKFELQRDGYDPARTADPLFVRDPSARDYVPVSAETLARLSLRPFAGDAG